MVIFGALAGTGAITGTGTTIQEGDLKPGSSPGTLTFAGDLVLREIARFDLEIEDTTAGTTFDRVEVAGNVTLDGTADILPMSPYSDPTVRATEDIFALLTWGTRTGTFDTVMYDGDTMSADFSNGDSFLDHAGSGRFHNLSYTATGMMLKNFLAREGDTDGDRDVDITDFTTLADGFDPTGVNSPNSWTRGNFDGDDDGDITDFGFLVANFAPTGYGVQRAVMQVPEPAGWFLASVALCGLAVRFASRR